MTLYASKARTLHWMTKTDVQPHKTTRISKTRQGTQINENNGALNLFQHWESDDDVDDEEADDELMMKLSHKKLKNSAKQKYESKQELYDNDTDNESNAVNILQT